MMSRTESNVSCDVVQDILPLYYDGVCSSTSRKLVEEHLQECAKCKKMLNEMGETEVEQALAGERQQVLEHHAKKEKSIAVKTAIVIAGLLLLPVLIALLLTLPGYSDLKTDAAIMASMLLVAGFTVVPLLSKGKKFTKTIVASTLALVLLIFVVEMFFDQGGFLVFAETAISTVFGLSLVFAPFVIRQLDLPQTLANQKGLLTFAWDTLWFYLMMITFALAYPDSIQDLLLPGTFFVALGWGIFATYRYLPANVWIKTGIMVALVGIWAAVGNALGWVSVSYTDKPMDVHGVILAVSLVAAAILTLVGALFSRKG